MDTETVFGMFIATWAQMAIIYYKVGKIEGHIEEVIKKK